MTITLLHSNEKGASTMLDYHCYKEASQRIVSNFRNQKITTTFRSGKSMLSFITGNRGLKSSRTSMSYNRTLRYQNCSTTDPATGFRVLIVTNGPFFHTVQL